MKTLSRNMGLTLIAVFILSSAFTAMGWKELTSKEKEEWITRLATPFRQQKMEINYEMRTYGTHEATNVQDAEKGYTMVSGDLSKSSFMGMETYRDSKYVVTVSKKEKTITIADASPELDTEIERIWTGFITDKCTMKVSEEESENRLQVLYPLGSSYSSSMMIADKKNMLKKVVVYMTQQIPTDPNDPQSKKTTPRLELLINTLNTSPTFTDAALSYASILEIATNGVKAKPEYKNYHIVDTRYQPTQKP